MDKDYHIKIIMIYADTCKKCALMKKVINSTCEELAINPNFLTYNCTDDNAVDIAIEYNITDVPGCNINGTVIEGEDFDKNKIVKILKKIYA